MSENMKPSGTDYLSEIPNTWDAKRMKFCVDICNGSEYADIVVDEGGFPVMGSGGEFARASKYCYTEKSVLLGRKGTIDKPLFIEEPFWCVDTMFYTKMNKGINAKYLYYCSLNIRFEFYVTSTALPSMTQRDLGSEKIAIPPLREQVVIAEFLDERCEKIDNIATDIEKQIEILQKYKKSLITETVTRGLDKSVSMKDCGVEWIGVIPEGWNIKRIKYLATLKGRIGWQGLTSDEYTDEGPFLITGVDFVDGRVDWDSCVHITKERWEEASEIQIQNGDLLITKDGTVGKVAIVSELNNLASLNSGVLVIKTNEKFNRRFLYWVLQSEEFWTWFKLKNAGNSTIIHLYQKDFEEFCYTYPEEDEQIHIADFLDEQNIKIDSIVESKKEQLTIITQHKKSLIYEYVTGKKRVKGESINGN